MGLKEISYKGRKTRNQTGMCLIALGLVFAAHGLTAENDGFAGLSRKALEARTANHMDEALSLYMQALRLKPNWDEGWWNAGSIAYDQDKYDECAPDFKHLTALKPDLAPAWTMEGLCEYEIRDYDRARASLLRAELEGFKGPPELAHSGKLHLCLLLNKAGTFEKSIVLLGELTRATSKTPEIITASGIAALRQPWMPSEVPQADRDRVTKLGDAMVSGMELDFKSAIAKFEIAEHDYPQDPDIHYRFGSFLMQQQPERGITEIKKTLELDPGHVPALVGLTMIYVKRGELEPARSYGATAVKTSPDDFATHVAYGRALLESDQAVAAAKELEQAVKLAPESVDARYSLGSAYSQLGRKEEAQRQFEEFKRLKKLTETPPS